MKEEYKKYFDNDFLMEPHGSNDLIFTCQYDILTKDISPSDSLTNDQLRRSLYTFINKELTEDSHDNHDAAICVSKRSVLTYHKQYKFGKFMLHPRDFIFYGWVTGGFFGLLFLPFLWISTICMIESVLNTTYKTINGVQVLETDGKLLTWMKINTFNLPVTKFICDFIVKRKYNGYKLFFDTYFKDPHHPNRILAGELNI